MFKTAAFSEILAYDQNIWLHAVPRVCASIASYYSYDRIFEHILVYKQGNIF